MAKTEPKFGTHSIKVRDSALVSKVFYDPNTLTLDAVFIKKALMKKTRYRYKRVPAKVFAEFVLAESMGAYFNKNIRNRYAFQQVE
jgi:hypothetical protein